MGQGASRDRNQTWELDAISDHQPKAGQHCSINTMQLSADNSTLVTGGEDNIARMWDITKKEPKCIGKLKGHSDYITQIAVVSTHVITGSADKTIRKWSMVDVSCEYIYEGHTQRIQRLICTPDYIISSSTDKTCMLWRLTDAIQDSMDRERTEEDPIDERWIRTFRGHTGTVYALCFVPGDLVEEMNVANDPSYELENEPKKPDDDGIHPLDILVTGSGDGTARSWNMATGKPLKVFKGHRGAVMLMAINSIGTLLYTAGDDTTVRQWDLHKGIIVLEIKKHEEAVSSMILAHVVPEEILFTGSADAKARRFNTHFGDLTTTFGNHRDTVSSMHYSEAILFTACTDSVARAFDARTGRLLRVFAGHEAAITCMQVTWKLKHKRLYTGSDDGILRVWDAHVMPEEISQIENIDDSGKSVEDSGAGAQVEGEAEAAAE